MPTYTCKHCDARNRSQGQCVNCLKPLGSYRNAIVAGVVAAVAYGLLWFLIFALIGIQHTVFAILYGGIISAVVTIYSGGRGFSFQFIATAFTIVGMGITTAGVVVFRWHEINPDWGDHPLPPFWDIVGFHMRDDPLFALLCTLGILGGCFIWHAGDGGE